MQVELNKEDIIHLLKGTEPATYGIMDLTFRFFGVMILSHENIYDLDD